MTQTPKHFLAGKSVLVTGGAGFIGSHIVDSLVSSGASVAVFDNLQAGSWENIASVAESVRRFEADVRDYSSLERAIGNTRPDAVFHLAANASVPGSVEDPRYDFEANCVGTVALLESLRVLGLSPTVVLASSAAVYGQPVEFPIVESTPLAPISPYGASKVSAEVEGRIWAHAYGSHVVIARLFNTYGPRMPRFAVIDFLRKLKKDPSQLEILGDGKQIRDFNYVADTVSGLLALAQSGEPGEAYNVASGTSCSVTELALKLLRVLGLEQTRITYTGSSWVGDAQRWEVDISKLRALGYEPKVNLETGLRQVADWFETL